MNNQNIHSMQSANGRFVPPQKPALVGKGFIMAGPPPSNTMGMVTHPAMAQRPIVMGPQPSLMPNIPYQQMGTTPQLMAAGPTAMMGRPLVDMAPMLHIMTVPSPSGPHPMVGVHLASKLSAVQRSNSTTSAPEPGQDIKDQVLALAGFSKEQMNYNSNTELPHRCAALKPDPIIALQQTVAGSVAPVASQAVTTRDPVIPEPSFTLLTAPTLRKRRNSMPATLIYDYFLQPLTEDRVGTILNKLGKRLDGEGLRLLYGAIQYFEYGHRDLLQANTDYELRKQHYEAMKKFRDEGNAKYFKLEKELEDMKRQHEYDKVKMAFFDQTLSEQWSDIRNVHPELPAEALSSHLFKERDDLRKEVQELRRRLNARDGARENLLAEKRKLEDEIRTMREEFKTLHERYHKRLDTVGRKNQSRETKLRHSFNVRIEELLEKARNSDDPEASKKLIGALVKEKKDTSDKAKEKLKEMDEQLRRMKQSGKGPNLKGDADTMVLKEKILAAEKAKQQAEEVKTVAEKSKEEADKKLEEEKKTSGQLRTDKRSQAAEMTRLQDQFKDYKFEVQSLKRKKTADKKTADTEINARNEAKQSKLNCEKLREEAKETRKGREDEEFQDTLESHEKIVEECLRVD